MVIGHWAFQPQSALGAEVGGWLAGWLAAQTNLQTWSADVTQTRTLKTLTQPLVARGNVWFAAPNLFRWELTSPSQTIAVRQPEQMLVIYPKLKRAERYPLNGAQAGPWKDALSLLEAGFPRSQPELESRFNVVSQAVSNAMLEVVLQPKSPSARRLMPEIRITVATNDFTPRARHSFPTRRSSDLMISPIPSSTQSWTTGFSLQSWKLTLEWSSRGKSRTMDEHGSPDQRTPAPAARAGVPVHGPPGRARSRQARRRRIHAARR